MNDIQQTALKIYIRSVSNNGGAGISTHQPWLEKQAENAVNAAIIIHNQFNND